MKKRLFLAIVLPMLALTVTLAQQSSDPLKNVSLTATSLPAPNGMTAYNPYWAHGRGFWKGDNLVFIDPRAPRVDLYNKDSIYSSIKIKFPDNADVHVYDAIVTTKGRLIVSGCYKTDIDSSNWHCFIGFANSDERVSPIVDTKEFTPQTISTCDDGATVWAFGRSRKSWNNERHAHDPYDALRQYDMADGRVKTSTLGTSTLSSGISSAGGNPPDQIMQCHDKTLGLYAGRSDEWIEYDTYTNKLSRWKLRKDDHNWAIAAKDGTVPPLPPVRDRVTGLAMLDSGEIFASFNHVVEAKDATTGLFRLVKSDNRGTWSPVEGTQGAFKEQGTFKQLEGTDGKNLVYSRFGEHNWFFSSPPE